MKPKYEYPMIEGIARSLFTTMLNLHKLYVLDENQQPVAVQIPIAEFEQIEEILENYGLAQLMAAPFENPEDGDRLNREDALQCYRSLKQNHVED